MKRIYSLTLALLTALTSIAQTYNSVANGNWNANSTWSTNTVPNGIGNVTVSNNVVANAGVGISNSGTLLVTGTLLNTGSAVSLSAANNAQITISGNTSFLAGLSMSNTTTLTITSGATLTVGNANLSNNAVIVVNAGGTLISNGNINMTNNVIITDNGTIKVNGNITGSNSAAIGGNGSLTATGTINVPSNTMNTTPPQPWIINGSTITYTGNVGISGTLSSGATTVSSLTDNGNLNVTGSSIFTGAIKNSTLAGTGNRLLQTDANGNILAFPMSTASQVLYGNGTWGVLPSQIWAVNASTATYTGNVGVTGTLNSGATTVSSLTNNGNLTTAGSQTVTGSSLFTGTIKNTALAGTGNRLVQTDANGNIISLSNGTASQVLYGNGTWGNLPATPTQLFTASGSNIYYNGGGTVGINTANPSSNYALDVNGDAHVANLYADHGVIIGSVNATKTVNAGNLNTDTIMTTASSARITVLQDVSASKGVNVGGDINAASALNVTGQVTFANSVDVGQKLTFKGGQGAIGYIAPGIVVPTPTVSAGNIVLSSNTNVWGNLSVKGLAGFDSLDAGKRISFGGGAGIISYAPAIGTQGDVFNYARGSGTTPPIITAFPCTANPVLNANTSHRFLGNLQAYGYTTGNDLNILTMSFDGHNGIIDLAGANSAGNPPNLLVNYYCGKDVAICTNTSNSGGSNNAGGVVSVGQNFQIGTPFFDINTALNVKANGAKAMVIQGNSNTTVFQIAQDGTTLINSGSQTTSAFKINVPDHTGAGGLTDVFEVNGNGDVFINGTNQLYLYGPNTNDHSHGLGVFGTFNNTTSGLTPTINGPVLHGFGGGALGSDQTIFNGKTNLALIWDNFGNVTLPNYGNSNNNLQTLLVDNTGKIVKGAAVDNANSIAWVIGGNSNVGTTVSLGNKDNSDLAIVAGSDLSGTGSERMRIIATGNATGNIVLNNNSNSYANPNFTSNTQLLLKNNGTNASPDIHHGLGYFQTYATLNNGTSKNVSIDGPVLYGYSGGALVTTGTSGGNTIALQWDYLGKIHVGTQTPAAGPYSAALMTVSGTLVAQEIYVATADANWADYVFKKDYKLMPLKEVEKYILMNQHLPNIPSANEVETKGQNLGELQVKQMEKTEELYLYIIEMNKKVEKLEEQNKKLISELEILKNK